MQLSVVMRNDLNMRTGKMVAQAGHAAMMVGFNRFEFRQTDDLFISAADLPCLRTFIENPRVEVSFVASEELLLQRTIDQADFHVVTDSGLTEFGGRKTMTCGAYGIFSAIGTRAKPYAETNLGTPAIKQYLVMSRENAPLKQTAIAMAGIGCLTEIGKLIEHAPGSEDAKISKQGREELFEWMSKGYAKIGLQIPSHARLLTLAERLTAAGVSNTLVEYLECVMLVTEPRSIETLKPFMGSLKLL